MTLIGMAPWDPLVVQLPLWESVVLSDTDDNKTPTLAFWDTVHRRWRLDGFSNVSLDKELNMLKFSTIHVAPITLVQKRGMHHGIHEWELSPAEPSILGDVDGIGVTLTIVGDHMKVQIRMLMHPFHGSLALLLLFVWDG